MKIKTQFILSMAIFSVVLLIIAASVIVTNQQIAWLNEKQAVLANVQQGADKLNTISSQYFLYQNPQLLTFWQSNINSISGNLSNLKPTDSEHQTLVNNAGDHLEQLNVSFSNLVSFLEKAPRNVSVRIIPEFQNNWNQTILGHQTFSLDASQLSESLRIQADELRLTNIRLILALVGVFGAFLITIYLITYRRTLKSISNLQIGINSVGSGELDYSIQTKKEDELSELSRAFNKMIVNLKTVTASKAMLEQEIAGRIQAEIGLRESEQRLNRSQEIAHLGSWELDVVRNKLSWSDEVYRIFGLKPQEFGATYEAFLQAVHPDDCEAVNAAYSESLREGKDTYEIQHRVIRKSTDEIRIVYEKCEHVRDENGKIIRSIGMVLDITDRKMMEVKLEEYNRHLEDLVEERTKQLKDSERLAAIGATAGMVGHDIRNPLQAIAGDLYLIENDVSSLPEGETKKDLQESLRSIQGNLMYVAKIVEDLQDYAKPLKPNFEKTRIEKIIEEVMLLMPVEANHQVIIDIEKGFPEFDTDFSMLKRVVSNLVHNAIQAMPNGGRLTIEAYRKKSQVLIEVGDTGVGIPEEVKSKLFSPLVTTKSKGQGLGLAVVKRIVEGLNGKVSFESEIGKGTKFIIQLPAKVNLTKR